jgi:uncharacterized protein
VIASLALALAFVLIVEGLVLALAPSRVEQALALLASLDVSARRLLGLLALVLGVSVLALARALGA